MSEGFHSYQRQTLKDGLIAGSEPRIVQKWKQFFGKTGFHEATSRGFYFTTFFGQHPACRPSLEGGVERKISRRSAE